MFFNFLFLDRVILNKIWRCIIFCPQSLMHGYWLDNIPLYMDDSLVFYVLYWIWCIILPKTFRLGSSFLFFLFLGNKRRISLIDHISTSTEDSLYTSMEALNNSSFGGGGIHQHQNNNRRNQNRVKVLPDLNEQPTKPSRTNPNVVFKRPSSMSSLMY